MPNPFWRDDATWTVNNLAMMPAAHGALIIARSGGTNVGLSEPAHVSLYLVAETGYWQMVDLNGAEGTQIQVNVTAQPRPPADLPPGDSIFRGFDLGGGYPGHVRLMAARAKALQIRGQAATITYRKISSHLRSGTLNCAEFAEKVMRAADLNVSAGFFVASPLELTTGRSRVKRQILSGINNCAPAAPARPWYQRFQR